MSIRPIAILSAWILFSATIQNVFADTNSTDSNGLYYVSSSETPRRLKTDDGSIVSLGKKAEIRIRRARVYSENNANTGFAVRLDTSDYPVEPNTGALIEPVVLRIGEHLYPWTGGGGAKGTYNAMFFKIHNQEEAKSVAKYLSVDCTLRSSPGYRFFAQFVPTQAEFHTNGPVRIKFRVKNLDERTIAFQRGGQQRGPRDNQYGFRAMLNNQPVADTGDPVNFGGPCGPVDLEPGKEFEDQIDLKKWFGFAQAGTYFIHGFYRLEFLSRGDEAETLAPWNVVWNDYASADFEVVVK